MFTKYILCILTIEWAVIGTWLLKGKGKSYERIQKNDKIHEKDRFIRFQGMNLLYLALTSFLALLTTFAGSDRLTLLFFRRRLPVSVRPASLRKLEIRRKDLDPVVK
ncbi:MAG: hypothetical protein V8S93_04605 [Lachnospiraceae bacterium]